MYELTFLICVLVSSIGKGHTMVVYKDCERTYSQKEMFSLNELKFLYARTEKKSTYELQINDRSKADVVVRIDAANGIHLRPALADEWTGLDGTAALEKEIIAHTAFTRGRPLSIYLVLDPKSTPEKAGEAIQLIRKTAFVELTVKFGKRVVAKGKQ
jgi:hypothetical protein